MKLYDVNIKHFKGKGYLKFMQYENGRMAIQLMTPDDPAPIGKITVNMPEVEIESDEIIVKDYGENEGMFDFLRENKIAFFAGKGCDNGYVQCPIMKVNPELLP